MAKKRKKIIRVWIAWVEGDFAGSDGFYNEASARAEALSLARAERSGCEGSKEPRLVYLMQSVMAFIAHKSPKILPVKEIVPV